MVVSNRNLLFQGSIFKGYVSFREGILRGSCWNDILMSWRFKPLGWLYTMTTIHHPHPFFFNQTRDKQTCKRPSGKVRGARGWYCYPLRLKNEARNPKYPTHMFQGYPLQSGRTHQKITFAHIGMVKNSPKEWYIGITWMDISSAYPPWN